MRQTFERGLQTIPKTHGLVLHQDAIIGSGLAGGETVVTDGQLRLVPGGQVVIKESGSEKGETP